MPPFFYPTDTSVIVDYCFKCGDVVYKGHPHKRHHICAECGEPCRYYGPFGSINGRDYVCDGCVDPTLPAWGDEAA